MVPVGDLRVIHDGGTFQTGLRSLIRSVAWLPLILPAHHVVVPNSSEQRQNLHHQMCARANDMIAEVKWPENIPVDRLDPSALIGLDVPANAHATLIVTGLPRDLETSGVTVFTSAIADGVLSLFTTVFVEPNVRSFVAAQVASLNKMYLLGTMQRTIMEPRYNMRAYCLDSKTGEVIQVDLVASGDMARRGKCTRFVNSSLPHFLSCLLLFYPSWLTWITLKASITERRRLIGNLRRGLKHRDPRALDDPDNFWFMPLEEMSTEQW